MLLCFMLPCFILLCFILLCFCWPWPNVRAHDLLHACRRARLLCVRAVCGGVEYWVGVDARQAGGLLVVARVRVARQGFRAWLRGGDGQVDARVSADMSLLRGRCLRVQVEQRVGCG